MQINNYYLSPLGVGQAGGQSVTEPAGKEPVASPAQLSSSHTTSADLLRIISLVQQEPEVRPATVQQVVQRLDQGWYAMPASAEQTAEAILKASE